MGCTESLFKKKPKDEAESADANGEAAVDGDLKNGDAGKKAGKSKSAKPKDKKKGKDKKDKKGEDGASGEAPAEPVKNGSSKTGANSAKVRPLTPTPPPITNQNVPKPVAFDVTLDGKHEGDEADGDASATVVTSDLKSSSGHRLRMPRKLPKLSSLNGRKDSTGEAITSEEIQEKQRKAEEKRQEILESKKMKARKFVTKFGNGSKSASVTSDQEEGDEEAEDEEMTGIGMNGMAGLDSGVGLDNYGLDADVKIDANGMIISPDGEDYRTNRIDTAPSSAPVVVHGDVEVVAK